MLHDSAFDPDELSVMISELLVATADGCDPSIDNSVTEVLRTLRERLKMDVVFVSEFIDGRRVFRFVDGDNPPMGPGDGNPLEESWCKQVVDGRMPQLVHDASAIAKDIGLPHTDIAVGAHLSTPIVLPDGRVYGTLCCYSAAANPALRKRDLDNLRNCAVLVARKLTAAWKANLPGAAVDGSLEPISAERWKLK
ncbi:MULTISPECIES: GAF domain-containing protein [unclassified Rhizobacter]|uniref:GAF domain-containing protein n=1 Tax=unclassified Rhizobacter TaxID=2640088 RepID=UPI0006F83F66|nr:MULTISPECIES: GAF domain-containing protein [unclassified Rhizobacter]KQU65078.1 hypothetical protein ASC88_11855 [Rhizobacter sp. Root29]KQW00673.1 hypothetical protein ASC98_28860 [Rhizobacter sp. Root1238]KRB09915.1 hypothetical protein ASE08_29160 [Rhizobacter sp. Root16D2]